MTSPALTLYHFPGACSRVTVCALEMAELAYELKLINLRAREQFDPAYLAMSKLGKVPLLLVDGVALTENPAIITLLAGWRPDAGILPADMTPWTRAEATGGLSFCSATLHPSVRGFANPANVTNGDGEQVRNRSHELLVKNFGYANARLAERGWWLDTQSIVDVYLDWAFSVACGAGFDPSPFPHVEALSQRLDQVPAYRRMQQEEIRSRIALGL